MAVLRRTWLATVCFFLASTATWLGLGSWELARLQMLPTLVLTPLVWWFVVGRRSRAHLGWGAVGGALTGLVTQSARNTLDILGLLSHRGTFVGDDQAIAMFSLGVFLGIGLAGAALGALVGMVVASLQQRVEGSTTTS